MISEFSSHVTEMTPAMAEVLLGKNTHNRHLRPTVVARYARDMAAGGWLLNGETIKIASDGLVIDGQHRLQAVIEAGVSIRMLVVEGLSADVQDTVDRGLPRNLADALRLRGEVNVTALAGALVASIVLEAPSPTDVFLWPSTREGLIYFALHPDLRDSAIIGGHANKTVRFPTGAAAALHHQFAHLDGDDAAAFWARLSDGADLSADSPILRLREMLLREISAQRRMSKLRLLAVTIKAWNAYRAGRPMFVLRWKTGGADPEKFPVPE